MGIDFASMDESLNNRRRKSIFDPTPNLGVQVVGEKKDKTLLDYIRPELFQEVKPENLKQGLELVQVSNPYKTARTVFGLPFYELKKPVEGEIDAPPLAPYRRSVVNIGSTISQGPGTTETATEKDIAMDKEELSSWNPKSSVGKWWKKVQEKNVQEWEHNEFMKIYEDVEDYQAKIKEGQRISNIAEKTKELAEDYVEPGFWGQAKEGQQRFWNNLMAISSRNLERTLKDKGFPVLEKNAERITDYFRTRSAEHPEWNPPSEFATKTLLEKLGDKRYYARALSEGLPITLISLGAGAITLIGTKGNTGAALGSTYLTSKYLEGGFAYEEAISNGASPKEADEYSDLYSTIAAGVELVPAARLLDKISGGAAIKRTLVNRVIKEVIIQGGLEGGEEAIQESTAVALEKMYNENAKFWTEENIARIADAGAQGSIVGFVTGGGGEVVRTSQDIYDGIKQKSIEALQADLTQQLLTNQAGFTKIPEFRDILSAQELEEILPDEPNSLIEEARKYKTVEDFAYNAEGLATRMGEIDKNGAYFATSGESIYFDPLNQGVVKGKNKIKPGEDGRQNYYIGDANLVVSDTPQAIEVLRGSLTDPENTPADIIKIKRELANGTWDYHMIDEIPSIVKSAKELGYDGIKLWESDDISKPSSVFLWNTDKAKQIGDLNEIWNRANTIQFTGENIAKEAKEMGSNEGGISDYLFDQIKSENYISKYISIDALRKTDPDLDEFLNNGEIREFEGDTFIMDPIVSSKGEVLDGYNRIAQRLADGEIDISILQGVNKQKIAKISQKKTLTGKEQLAERERIRQERQELTEIKDTLLFFEENLEEQYQNFKKLNAKNSEDIEQLRNKNKKIDSEDFDNIFYSQEKSMDEVLDLFKERYDIERKPLPKLPKETKAVVAEKARQTIKIKSQQLITKGKFIIAEQKARQKVALELLNKLPEKLQGRMKQAILETTTDTRLQNLAARIKRRLEDYQKQQAINEALDLNRVAKKAAITTKYQEIIDKLISGYDFKRPTEKTISRLRATREFLENNKDWIIPNRYIQEIKRLEQKSLRDMTASDIKEFNQTLNDLVELGKEIQKHRIIVNKLRFKEQLDKAIKGIKNLDSEKDDINRFKEIQNDFEFTFRVADKTDNTKLYKGWHALFVKNLGQKTNEADINQTDRLSTFWKDHLAIDNMTLSEREQKEVAIHLYNDQGGKQQAAEIMKGLDLKEIPVLNQKQNKIADALRKLVGEKTDKIKYLWETTMVDDNGRPMSFQRQDNYFPFYYEEFSSDLGVYSILQDYRMQSKVIFGSGYARKKGVDLKPRTDIYKMAQEAVAKQELFLNMQPSLYEKGTIFRSKEYQNVAGKFNSKYWVGYIDEMSRNGFSSQAVRTPMDKWLRRGRQNISRGLLDLSITSTAIQPLAIFDAMGYMTTYHSKKSAFKMAKNLVDMFIKPNLLRDTKERSLALKTRAGGEEVISSYDDKKLSKGQRIPSTTMQKIAAKIRRPFALLQFFDIRTAAAVQKTAYDIFIGEGLSEEQARAEADFIMDLTSGSSNLAYRPRVMNKGEVGRALTTFQTFVLNEWGIATQDIVKKGIVKGGDSNSWKIRMWAVVGLSLLFMQSYLEEELRRKLSEVIKKKEVDKIPFWKTALLYFPERIPILGNMITGVRYGRQGIAIPTVDIFSNIIAESYRVVTGKASETKLKALSKVMESVAILFFGLPGAKQVQDLIEPVIDGQKSSEVIDKNKKPGANRLKINRSKIQAPRIDRSKINKLKIRR